MPRAIAPPPASSSGVRPSRRSTCRSSSSSSLAHTRSCSSGCGASTGSPWRSTASGCPLWLAPGLARRALKNGASLYETLELELGVRLSSARQRITAVAASEREADILEVELGSPLLFTQRLTRDSNNRPVEFAESWTVPKLSLWVDLHR